MGRREGRREGRGILGYKARTEEAVREERKEERRGGR